MVKVCEALSYHCVTGYAQLLPHKKSRAGSMLKAIGYEHFKHTAGVATAKLRNCHVIT